MQNSYHIRVQERITPMRMNCPVLYSIL